MKKLSDPRENWMLLIKQLLSRADADTLRQIYFLLRGYVGGVVSDPDTTAI